MYSLTKQQKQTKEGKRIGMVLTIAFHVVLLFVLGITGFRLVYPPPAEKGILLEIPLEEVPQKAVPKKSLGQKGISFSSKVISASAGTLSASR